MFSNVLKNLISSLKVCHNKPVNEIPALALLTGINTSDNLDQFKTLSFDIGNEITPHVATLYSQDCASVKNLIENFVSQFVNHEKQDVSSLFVFF